MFWGRISDICTLNEIKRAQAIKNAGLCFIIRRGVFWSAYQLLISLVWVINVTLIPSLSVMISRDCLGAVHLMILTSFCLQTECNSTRGNTKDEGGSGCFCGARINEFLLGVWLPETVQLWRDYSMQSERFDDLEENITREHHTTVSRHNLFARIAARS